MTIRIGIIGAGIMGNDHARIAARDVTGVRLSAICDTEQARANAVAAETGAETVLSDPVALIRSKSVDAVIIASPDATHAELALACLKAGKPVLCEKPLAPSAAEGMKVLKAEVRLGKRLIRLGFMRRHDPAYVAMKSALLSGKLGRALMLHCIHRNVSVPDWFTTAMAVGNSGVHELDITRWLLDCEIAKIQVFQPRTSDHNAVVTPIIIVMESTDGQIITVEVFNNAVYGYDVRGELVCEKGTISLGNPALTESSQNLARFNAYDADWRPRFGDAYRIQMQEWVRDINAGSIGGASTWDGYAAAIISEAGVRSLSRKSAVAVTLPERPGLYA